MREWVVHACCVRVQGIQGERRECEGHVASGQAGVTCVHLLRGCIMTAGARRVPARAARRALEARGAREGTAGVSSDVIDGKRQSRMCRRFFGA